MSPASPIEARVRARLVALERDGLLRTLRPPTGIDLSSNDYLNLATDSRVTARFIEATAREGCGSTGSRLLRGERDAFARLESRFASFKGTERALYFSSGYLANLAVLSGLAEAGDTIISDEGNHASLIDGARLSRAHVVVSPHNNPSALGHLLRANIPAPQPPTSGPQPPTSSPQPRSAITFVVVESLHSMDGDIAPLAEYADVCHAHGAVLIVDEAHAVGIYGTRGSGLIEAAGLDANRVVSVNAAGKALGAAGAFVAGPAWAVEYLVQRARPFVFSTAPPPAIAGAIEASLAIVEQEPDRRERLLCRSAYARRALRRSGLDIPDGTSQIIPVLIGDNERAVATAAALQARGFDIRAIRPPSVPVGTARLRVSVNAALSEPVLDEFVSTLTILCSAACL